MVEKPDGPPASKTANGSQPKKIGKLNLLLALDYIAEITNQ